MFDHPFWQYSGLVFWGIILIFILSRLILGKNWQFKLGSTLFLGPGLKTSLKKLVNEFRERKVKDDTLVDVAVYVFWRLTRAGLIGLIIAGLPVWLLMQQNKLIDKQNELFTHQNIRIDEQTELINQQTKLLKSQDEKFGKQNVLLEGQNSLFTEQNSLFTEQNRKVEAQAKLFQDQNQLVQSQNMLMDSQNERLKLQNNLIEADRRSSLVFLMSNILDKVDSEISIQKNDDPNDYGYFLSDPLMGRIIALSRAFKPYRILGEDTLSSELYSPERGQLFIALMECNLDTSIQQILVTKGDFSFAPVGKIEMDKANFSNANFQKSIFSGSKFFGADFV